MPQPHETRDDTAAARPLGLIVDFATVWLTGLFIRLVLFSVVTGSPLPKTSLRWFEQAGLIALRLLSIDTRHASYSPVALRRFAGHRALVRATRVR